MRLYYEIALRSFRRATQYRAAYLAGILTNAFFGAVRSFVYIALFAAGASTVAGLNVHDTVSYAWATQALISIGAGWLSTDIAATIRSGDVSTDMARPWSFFGYWMSRWAGERLGSFVMRGGFTYAFGVLLFGAQLPNPLDLLPFAFSVACALVIAFTISYLVNLTAFWLIEISGLVLITNTVQAFFSGFLLPIALFPPWLAAVAHVLPFQSIAGYPAQIFLGQVHGHELLVVLASQLFWAVGMSLLALAVTQVAVRKVVVQGG